LSEDKKPEITEHQKELIKIDGTNDDDSLRPLPARWESVNDAFKMVDKTLVDAIHKYKLSAYEVHLVLACFEFKKDTVQIEGYFKDALRNAIEEMMKQKEDKTPDFIK